jgi:N-methylhydantoinase A
MAGSPPTDIRRDFLLAHDRIYGHAAEGSVELVNVRVVQQAPAPAGENPVALPAPQAPAEKAPRRVLFESGAAYVEARVFERAGLRCGASFTGPAIIEQADTTTVVEPGWRVEVDARSNLVLTPCEAA